MKLRKYIALLVSMFTLLASLVPGAYALGYGEEWSKYNVTSKQKYSDVSKDYWAYESIDAVSDKKWFGGYPDGSFCPEASITRAEALKAFVTFLGLEVDEVTESSFSDVDVDEWYAPYIEAGKELFPTHTNIQGRCPFNPNMPVTREDTIYALVGALGCDAKVKNPDLSVLSAFEDAASISGNVKNRFAVALMKEHNLVSGYPDRTIRAQDPLTRAEFATLLLRGTKHGFHDVYEAWLESVEVFPKSPVELTIGESFTITAKATYTDGTVRDYAAFDAYDDSVNGVISLENDTVTGLKEGTATIRFNSEYLKKATLTVKVTKPTDGLKLKITEYPEETEDSRAEIHGLVEDQAPENVDLTCGLRDILVEPDGSFTTLVSLKPGENEFTFTAVNQYGVTAEKSITIMRLSAPIIYISSYPERTPEPFAEVEGIVSDSDLETVRLTCNGKEISFEEDGSFTVDVTLESVGQNPFTFEAVNRYEKSATQSIEIERYERYVPVIKDEDDDDDDDDDDELSEEVIEVPDAEVKVKGKVELAFVIDTTGSMEEEIGNVKTNIAAFSRHLEEKGVDLKMTVIEYRDITYDGKDSTRVLSFGDSPWHTTADSLAETLGRIVVNGGGDEAETALDGFGKILNNRYMDWSGDAYKFTVLLTDAGLKLDNTFGFTSLEDAAERLAEKKIVTSVISYDYLCRDVYAPLVSKTGGITGDICSNFEKIHNELADKIVDVSL